MYVSVRVFKTVFLCLKHKLSSRMETHFFRFKKVFAFFFLVETGKHLR